MLTVQDERDSGSSNGALVCLSTTWTSAMASTSSDTAASTQNQRKRRLLSDGDQPSPKRQKKETELDRIKDSLKEEVRKLKTELVRCQEDLLSDEVAKSGAKVVYNALLGACDRILGGNNPNKEVLAVFKVLFTSKFKTAEDLRAHIDECVLPC